jgi:hypothetical protein
MEGRTTGGPDSLDQTGIIIDVHMARAGPRLRLANAMKIYGEKAMGIFQFLREGPPLASSTRGTVNQHHGLAPPDLRILDPDPVCGESGHLSPDSNAPLV